VTMNIQRVCAQIVALGCTTEDGDDERTHANADLESESPPTGENSVIKMGREKNMPMSCCNIFNTFELQNDIPP
jgi:hypothetical protein